MLRTTNLWSVAPSVCSQPACSPHPYVSDPATAHLLIPCLLQPRWPPSFLERAGYAPLRQSFASALLAFSLFTRFLHGSLSHLLQGIRQRL